jgi:hypothetical protein
MSRGPGRIERSIRALFDLHPDLAFITDDLVEHCFPSAGSIERKHRVSVLRAAHSVIAADPNWREMGRGGQCGVFVNLDNLQSYALGKLALHYLGSTKWWSCLQNYRRACGNSLPGLQL